MAEFLAVRNILPVEVQSADGAAAVVRTETDWSWPERFRIVSGERVGRVR